ncbi:hypothetical protein B5M09_005921 [Aphanomyces astaci]|uniref:Uncharacterized protein n=1 Tax=Aphanomyces astaci TaxID=112090 RepID=A0A3R7X492_APHAT|nr:hypothetical protein B5M09_005921 [Aphanomyces astaci]
MAIGRCPVHCQRPAPFASMIIQKLDDREMTALGGGLHGTSGAAFCAVKMQKLNNGQMSVLCGKVQRVHGAYRQNVDLRHSKMPHWYCVIWTSKEGTIAWIELLLRELRHHVAVPVDSSEWSEDTLGTLLSAAGMTVRYVTEAPTFVAYLPEFESIFLHVLGIPNWTKPFLGLKMVALRGCTRLLESFGEVVQRDADVLAWISSSVDVMLSSSDDPTAATCIQLLLRPTCEHLNVIVQVHPRSIPLSQALATTSPPRTMDSLEHVSMTIESLRDLLLRRYQCLVVLVHVLGHSFWDVELEFDFLHAVVVKIADPLVFGDFLFALRPTDADETDRYASKVAEVVAIFVKGLRQAHRYSKTLALRMVDGVAHVALGAGVYLHPHLAVLADTLLDMQAMNSSSSVRNASTRALTRLYCLAPFAEEAAAAAYFNLVTEGVLAMREPALESLSALLHDKTATVAAAMDWLPSAFWLEWLASCSEMFAAIPIFEEDVPVLTYQLGICHAWLTALRPDDVLTQGMLNNTFRPAVQTLRDTAHADGLVGIVDAADSLLALL